MARKPTVTTKKEVIPQEIGVTHSSVFDFDYCLWDENKDLQFPYNIQTFNEMKKDASIAAALAAIQVIALRVPRYVEAYDDTDTHQKRARFVDDALGVTKDNNDMTQSFDDFLREAMSMNTFGFSVHEIVYRRRLYDKGSKFDDGKVGIKRLPIRPQASIEEFVYDDSGRDIVAVKQQKSINFTSRSLKALANSNGLVDIPYNRILHFKADSKNGDPRGVSPLTHVYDVWREIQRYKDLENIASSKNLNGLPLVYMPAAYMQADVSTPMGKIYQEIKNGISSIAIGQQSSLILPSDREELSGAGGKLFEASLLSASSSSITSITAIRQSKERQALQCLFSDGLIATTNTGTEAVTESKTAMLNKLVETRIKEVFSVLNDKLIPEWFRQNGWDAIKTPKIMYGELKEFNLEEFAKAMQQIKATNLVAITPENINHIAEKTGLPTRVRDDATMDELKEILGVEDKMDSKSGQGYSSDTGGLNGTGNSVSDSDNSANNLSNK